MEPVHLDLERCANLWIGPDLHLLGGDAGEAVERNIGEDDVDCAARASLDLLRQALTHGLRGEREVEEEEERSRPKQGVAQGPDPLLV